MQIEDVSAMWAEDCHINRNDLTVETLRTANLHQKYLDLLMRCKNKLIKYSSDFMAMRELKTRYYNGELSQEELYEHNLKQYQGLKPLKSAMVEKLDGDADLLQIKMKVQYVENMVYMLESILSQIKGRDWQIKNHIDLIKFQAGN
jgi:glycosidase